jgi:ABC-type nitrate/sulfonate/bicarbonate transport system substrate-binding protein
MKNNLVKIILLAILPTIVFLFVAGCREKPREKTNLRIGYRASLPANVGALWAYETNSFANLDVAVSAEGFGPPHVLLQALKNENIDLVTVMPLEPVLEDILKGEANYFIFCLLCFSPSDEFDAIVVETSEIGELPSWKSLDGELLGVIPSKQNILIGKAIVEHAGARMDVKAFNPLNPLMSLQSGDFSAIHVLGADVARAKANSKKYNILEVCPASRHVFNGKITPAGVGLVSKKWVQQNPHVAKAVIDCVLNFNEKSRVDSHNPQLLTILGKEKYGGFDSRTAELLAYPPMISYKKVKESHFEPLLNFLEKKDINVPSAEQVYGFIYKGYDVVSN